MITEITATGLGEADFRMPLTAVNLIAGSSFSGKSTRLNALRLVLLGYVPRLGKRNEDAFAIARGATISVRAQNSASGWGKSWAKKGRGVTKTEDGTAPAIPPVLLDPSEYFSLGEKDRMRYVFSACQLDEEFNGAALVADVKNIRLDENTKETEAALKACAKEIDDSDTARHDSGESVQDWMETLISDMRDKSKLAGQNVKRMESTGQGLAIVKPEAKALRPHPEIPDLRKALIDAKSTLIGLKQQFQRAVSAKQARAEIEAKLTAPEFENLDQKIADAEKQIIELACKVQGYKSQTPGLREAHIRCSGEIRATKEKLQARETTRREDNESIEAVLCKPGCPTCGADAHGWQAKIRAGLDLRNKDADRTIAALKATIATHEATLKDILAKGTAAKAEDQKQETLKATLRGWQDEANTLANRKASLDAMRETLATQAPEPPTIDPQQIINMEVTVHTQSAKLELAEAEHRAWQREMDEEAQNARVRETLAKARAEAVVLKAVVKLLEEKQSKMVDGVFGKLISTANKLAGAILKSPLAYREGEVGRWAPRGVWVSIRAFSGTEEAVAFAALSLALAAQTPLRLVVIDEMGRMDVGCRALLANRILELQAAGDIEQAILVDTVSTWAPPGVNVITVESEVAK